MILTTEVDINIDSLVRNLHDHEEALDLIKRIDEAGFDWDFTMACAKHFVGLIVAGCKGDEDLHSLYMELKEMLV